MINKIRNKKIDGDSTFISSLVCIFWIIIIFVALLNIYGEAVRLSEVERIHRRYLLAMEREGYLSAANVTQLTAELDAAGVVNIDLTGTSLSPVGYGGTVYLVIEGDLIVDTTVVVSGSPATQEGARHFEKTKSGTALY